MPNLEVSAATERVEALAEGYNPRSDPIDQRILFEITGERLSADDYEEDSDFEESDYGIDSQRPHLFLGRSIEDDNELDLPRSTSRPSESINE